MSDDTEEVHRLIRIHVMQWLEMAVGIGSDAPPFDLNEVINQWYDWTPERPQEELYPAPTYTAEEVTAVVAVAAAVERFCAATPQTIVDEPAALSSPEWKDLDRLARQALAVMRRRGELAT